MKVKILGSASRDLIDGYRFYETQAEGVGAYFLDSLYSEYRFTDPECRNASRAFREIPSPAIKAISVRGLLPARRADGARLYRPRLPPQSGVDQKKVNLNNNGQEIPDS